jgi:hypothetical protein
MAQAIVHLDTSFLIGALKASSGEDRQLRRWMADGVKLGMSAIGWAEFLCGPLDQRQLALAAAMVGEPEPFVVRIRFRLRNCSTIRDGAGARFWTA